MAKVGLTTVRATIVAATLLIVVALWVMVSAPAPTVITVAGSTPDITIAQIVERSDAVAIVTPVGQPTIHWNSADNRPWDREQFGIHSHIYRDQTYVVSEIVSGSLPAEELEIRGVGGTLDNVTINYVDAPDPKIGLSYLVFLTYADTPTKEGVQRAWTTVGLDVGFFWRTEDGWVNAGGKLVPLDLSVLQDAE